MDLPITFEQTNQSWIGRFRLMASLCEIHLRTPDAELAKTIITQGCQEGQRIERHFSRYLNNNILHIINSGRGEAVTLDDEYAHLFNYAITLHQISDGMFDISSGVLRKAWAFGSDAQPGGVRVPSAEQLNPLLKHVGLEKIAWHSPKLKMPAGMELDFGGIGKEYAVDRVSQLIEGRFGGHYLVNFGGDCYCRGDVNAPWSIAVEDPRASETRSSANTVTLMSGGVATSGTTKRYFEFNGQRYGHILNPKTGWPVEQAPLSVTVVNQSCLAAGSLATLAMLRGAEAESFLNEQALLHWVLR